MNFISYYEILNTKVWNNNNNDRGSHSEHNYTTLKYQFNCIGNFILPDPTPLRWKGFFSLCVYFQELCKHATKIKWCTVWVKKNLPPPRGPKLLTFLIFLTNGWELSPHSPILTKLCHIKCNYPVHIICSKSPPSAKMHALTSLRKSLIALLIVVCGK